jgi:hypothetical protein
VVAEVVGAGLGCCGGAVEGCYADAVWRDQFRLSFFCGFEGCGAYTTMKTAMKTLANPAQVMKASFSNLRMLAHMPTMMAAMTEK